jgi:hypothetical protein
LELSKRLFAFLQQGGICNRSTARACRCRYYYVAIFIYRNIHHYFAAMAFIVADYFWAAYKVALCKVKLPPLPLPVPL